MRGRLRRAQIPWGKGAWCFKICQSALSACAQGFDVSAINKRRQRQFQQWQATVPTGHFWAGSVRHRPYFRRRSFQIRRRFPLPASRLAASLNGSPQANGMGRWYGFVQIPIEISRGRRTGAGGIDLRRRPVTLGRCEICRTALCSIVSDRRGVACLAGLSRTAFENIRFANDTLLMPVDNHGG